MILIKKNPNSKIKFPFAYEKRSLNILLNDKRIMFYFIAVLLKLFLCLINSCWVRLFDQFGSWFAQWGFIWSFKRWNTTILLSCCLCIFSLVIILIVILFFYHYFWLFFPTFFIFSYTILFNEFMKCVKVVEYVNSSASIQMSWLK